MSDLADIETVIRCVCGEIEANRAHHETRLRGWHPFAGEVVALAATPSRPEPGLRAAIIAALEPTCSGEDICDAHSELLFDGRCEDYDRGLRDKIAAALESTR